MLWYDKLYRTWRTPAIDSTTQPRCVAAVISGCAQDAHTTVKSPNCAVLRMYPHKAPHDDCVEGFDLCMHCEWWPQSISISITQSSLVCGGGSSTVGQISEIEYSMTNHRSLLCVQCKNVELRNRAGGDWQGWWRSGEMLAKRHKCQLLRWASVGDLMYDVATVGN